MKDLGESLPLASEVVLELDTFVLFGWSSYAGSRQHRNVNETTTPVRDRALSSADTYGRIWVSYD